ncbi:hypothetical protein EDD53_1574 [Pacificibacter maritimus]|uniref:Sulfotransferase family protein n=1 Tax=Pacificibacter maritimus TaxID=762213 RepID=A0A3N4UZZ1_9RHOB|nr:hypothetical protein [Pacificibacter maritimus]RPE67170.1 hypothetical protein EDD53_1574 [Pacificibacter maritimus]
MRITLHIGAHHTRTPRLVSAINAGKKAFARENIFAPGPASYRPIISKALSQLDGLPPIDEEEDAVLAEILGDKTDAEHLIMINEDWAGERALMFKGAQLYTNIGETVQRVAELFSKHELRISMAIRNPAFLINAAQTVKVPPISLKWFLKSNDPMDLSWQAPVDQVQKVLPNAKITMWCEEDTPLIWPRILRKIAGLPEDAPVRGALLAIEDALKPEGVARLRTFLRNHTLSTPQQYERSILAFLDKYADETVMSAACSVPGWTGQTVYDLSQNYEGDITALSKREGIDFILPYTQDDLA